MTTCPEAIRARASVALPLEAYMTPPHPHPTPPCSCTPRIRWWQTLPAIRAGILLLTDAGEWITRHIGAPLG